MSLQVLEKSDEVFLKVRANMVVELKKADGRIERTVLHNVVTSVGKTHVADQLASSPSEAAMGWMAVGTGADGGSDPTALTTELDRNALTSRTHTGAVVTYVGTWAAGDGTGTITEAGVFNQATLGGGMLVYSHFTGIAKGAGDTLTITWTLTVG